MACYLIANITVTDPEQYEVYREQMLPVVAHYGGRYLVRAGAVHWLEGDLSLDRLVVIEFDSLEQARSFYDSPEYAPLLKLRKETTDSALALVEGYTPA